MLTVHYVDSKVTGVWTVSASFLGATHHVIRSQSISYHPYVLHSCHFKTCPSNLTRLFHDITHLFGPPLKENKLKHTQISVKFVNNSPHRLLDR